MFSTSKYLFKCFSHPPIKTTNNQNISFFSWQFCEVGSISLFTFKWPTFLLLAPRPFNRHNSSLFHNILFYSLTKVQDENVMSLHHDEWLKPTNGLHFNLFCHLFELVGLYMYCSTSNVYWSLHITCTWPYDFIIFDLNVDLVICLFCDYKFYRGTTLSQKCWWLAEKYFGINICDKW